MFTICARALSLQEPAKDGKNRPMAAKANDDGSWWPADDEAPPSLRQQYPIRTSRSKAHAASKKPRKAAQTHNDEELASRLAKLTGKSMEEVNNPRFMVVENKEASSSADCKAPSAVAAAIELSSAALNLPIGLL